MVLIWIKRIFGIVTPPSNENDGDKITLPKSLDKEHSLRELENRKRIAREGKEEIKLSSINWYKIFIPKRIEKVPNNIFQAYKFNKVSTLKELKEERLKKEAHELKVLEDSVKVLLIDVESLIKKRNAKDAKRKLSTALEKIVKVKDSSIRQRLLHLQICLDKLLTELKQEELARLTEERRRREEEAKRQKEAEERAKKERERKELEERERKEAKAKRFAEEARQKENAERQERQRLEALSSELKDDWQSFKQVLDENGVRFLYHFTDVRNIPSIKLHGGLFSWYYCRTHGINIPCQGGDIKSQELDKRYGLEDYVRLSFCNDHPMKWRLEQSGSTMKILKIKVDVALLKETQFSDMNAADERHTHGKTLMHLRMVDFDATRMHYLRNDDPNFKPHQAEVMVKTFIPLKYIENI
ncbi:MAG: DUF4433 domain-containing protein [Paludibacteraceae bacterium]|nr:DUF4433 domain-containing protein [Paludibacteraceae bacterium]